MSSLAVQLSRIPAQPPDEASVRRGLAAAPHRGTNISTVSHGLCVLGVSFHPGEERASVAVQDGLAVAVAGDIVNAHDLAEELRITRAHPGDAASSPALVVLAGYRAYGDSVANKLRGSYAVAISDGYTLTCFRDHIGLATLFFRDEAEWFYAASEAKQVAAAAAKPLRPALDAIEQSFYAEESDETGSFIDGVLRLPKAVIMEATQVRTRSHRYWYPEQLVETSPIRHSEIAEQFHTLMSQAVGRVLIGRDVIALSGGVDSPTLAAYAAPLHEARFGHPLQALSMVFPDYPSCDESPYIDAVARQFGIPVDRYQPSHEARGLANLDEWVRLTDGPWGGAWAPGMDVERYTRIKARGKTNLITGDLAEYVSDFSRHLVPHLLLRGRIRPLLAYLQAKRRSGTRLIPLARSLAVAFVPGSLFRRYREWKPRIGAPHWVDRRRALRGSSSDLVGPHHRWRRHQLAAFIGPGVSMEAYQIFSEAQQIQVRCPWGDVDVWEFFLRLPAEMKFPGPQPKSLVRTLMRGRLTDQVLDRRDKTVLDEFVRASFDYASVKLWISTVDFRMPGIDYDELYRSLDRQDLGIFEYLWAADLARVHAFLKDK